MTTTKTPPGEGAARFGLRALTAALATALCWGMAPAPATAAAPDLGPNVRIFDPSMPTSEIQAVFDEIWAAQKDNEMGSDRYALFFMPGTYGTNEEPLHAKVGYYTEVAGLGASPLDVTINGKVEVFNRCFDDPLVPEFVGCFALNNFWRGLSNLSIQVNGFGQDGCTASSNFWAVSQAVSMRRVNVMGGNLSLMDYCTGPAFASGGFIADSSTDVLINGSQQQWFTRNSEVAVWTNPVWNQVFSGVIGAPDDSGYPATPYTTLDTTPVSREKPFLYVDGDGEWQVRVSDAQFDSSGITWASGMAPGRSIPLSNFFIAMPGDSAETINAALARGKHLFLTPGTYELADSIQVIRPNTVVLGSGIATLKAVQGSTPLVVHGRPGIVIAGMTIDAGDELSQVLLQVGGTRTRGHDGGSDENPITLSDVYFRVGGPYIGKTETAMQIDSDHVLIDHTWVWRADHGIEGFDRTVDGYGDTERWATNIGRQGLIVNGDDVTATGLFVEHFQKYNTTWNGERGRVYFYQNELPYDPPSQSDWIAPDGTLGFAGYKVADHVQEHELWGGGVYCFNRLDPTIVTENGYEVPDGPGIDINHVMTKNLSGPGIINAVINGVGDKVDGIPDVGDPDNYEDPTYVVNYS